MNKDEDLVSGVKHVGGSILDYDGLAPRMKYGRGSNQDYKDCLRLVSNNYAVPHVDSYKILKDEKIKSLVNFNDKLVVFLLASSLLKNSGLPELGEGDKNLEERSRKKSSVWGLNPFMFLFMCVFMCNAGVLFIANFFSRLGGSNFALAALLFVINMMVIGVITMFSKLEYCFRAMLPSYNYFISEGNVVSSDILQDLNIDVKKSPFVQMKEINNYLMWVDMLQLKVETSYEKRDMPFRSSFDEKKLSELSVALFEIKLFLKEMNSEKSFIEKKMMAIKFNDKLLGLTNCLTKLLYDLILVGNPYEVVVRDMLNDLRGESLKDVDDLIVNHRRAFTQSNNDLLGLLMK